MPHEVKIMDTLESIEQETHGDKISIGDIVEVLNHRGFGPMLIAPALITVLPTGAIPGIPAVCGIFIIFVAAQMVMGCHNPWLPSKLTNIKFSRKKYENGIEQFKPFIKKIDNCMHPRYQFLTNSVAQKIIAVICIVLSIFMVVLGFIPFVPALFAMVILMLGLGVSVQDGLLTALSVVPLIGAIMIFTGSIL